MFARVDAAFLHPDATHSEKSRIRDLGEQLDAHRKRQQAAHPGLTITDMYNVLAKLRAMDTASDRGVSAPLMTAK